MPTLYTDSNGSRVVIRHKGPAGRGIAAGGTTGQRLAKASDDPFDTEWVDVADVDNAAISDAVGVDNEIALYDGAARKIKTSGKTVADFALATALDGKVNVDGVKVLSDVNFTTALKSKLELVVERYRGAYANAAALPATAAVGDYATLVSPSSLLAFCAVVNTWTVIDPNMTALEIAALIFNNGDYLANFSGPAWNLDNCRVFTNSDKAALDTHTQLLNALNLGITAYRRIDAAYTVVNSDRTVDVTTGTITVSLPTALTNAGTIFTIKNSGAGTVTVDCVVGTEEIDGNPTVSLATLEWVTVQSTGFGTGYIIIG